MKLTAATVLLSVLCACSRIAAQSGPTTGAEDKDQCVAKVAAQYEQVSEHTLKGRQDAHETAVLLCRF